MTAIARHWVAARAAMAAERARAGNLMRVAETDFLPEALEIVQRPVSPTGRGTAWLLLAGFATLSLWLFVGRVDMVVTAQGRIAPAGDVKIIQSAQPGTIHAILVREGQVVRAGQPLIELDPTMTLADGAQARAALETAQLDLARDSAILQALDRKAAISPVSSGPPAALDVLQTDLAREVLASIRSAAAARAAAHQASLAARNQAHEQVTKIDQTLPLLNSEVAMYEELLAKGFVPKIKVLEMRRQQLAAARDREIFAANERKAGADALAAAEEMAQSYAEARSRILQDMVRARAEIASRYQDLAKATERSRLQLLRSPVDGIAAQIAVHTVGGVVEVAKPLMMVVPTASGLIAQVRVLNKDVGFIRPGQPVVLKLAAFPFTRFGTVSGRVQEVSADAIDDPKLGLVFPARIAIDARVIRRDGATHRIVPGMALAADVRTGRRSLMSYLLSPLRATAAEAATEQ